MRSYQRWVMESSVGLVSACSGPVQHVLSCDAPADATLEPLAQQADVKASHTGNDNYFGTSVALWADGSTLAVSA